MNFAAAATLLFLASYLLGAVPFGLIVSRLKGVDIRKHGSGNIGATNVGRVLGREWGALVLLLDATKGALTSVGASLLLTHFPAPWLTAAAGRHDLIRLGTGLCCVIGNMAPIYLRFKGGKGVATTLGVILGVYPYLTFPALVATVLWALTVALTRYVSLGSIVAALSLPVAFLLISRFRQWPLADHYPLLALCLLVGAAIIVRHRSNIGRLLSGTENRIGSAAHTKPDAR